MNLLRLAALNPDPIDDGSVELAPVQYRLPGFGSDAFCFLGPENAIGIGFMVKSVLFIEDTKVYEPARQSL